jgi:serine-type D-Ala-D-Ala carboxypeptidase/endopeptidase (penicillin-binding protein 4)
MPRQVLIGLVAALLLALVPAAAAQTSDSTLAKRLAAQMRGAGASSGAYVVNTTDDRVVLRVRHTRARILASNTKLFTTATALARFGTEGTLPTEVLGTAEPDLEGLWRGNLYLRGGGDPTFGTRSYTRRSYGTGATVEDLAAAIEDAGIARISGRIVGDESRFDAFRGGPDTGFAPSVWMGGRLSALSFNRGFADERGRSWQAKPAQFAAARLDRALERRGIRVSGRPAAGRTPADANVVASVESPPMSTLARITNKPSDNFFAEMLVKAIGFEATGRGTTARGARTVSAFARRLGARASIADGSGLSRGDRASPLAVVRLLRAMQARDEFEDLYASLPVAGRDGTLASRMRGGAARGRCHAKTGTLSDVSALSGWCEARSGDVYAFSFLMNRVNTWGARAIQDKMAHLIAAAP